MPGVACFCSRQILAGVTLNDIMHHAGNDNLPFGGVGDSGMGSYHGVEGFRNFRHGRSIQQAALFSLNFPLIPPHGKLLRKLLGSMSENERAAVRKRLGKPS